MSANEPEHVAQQLSAGAVTDFRVGLRDKSRRGTERCVRRSRAHSVAADFYSKVHARLGLPTAVLAAAAGVSGLTDRAVAAGLLAIAVTGLSAVGTFLQPAERAHQHSQFSRKFGLLSERFQDVGSLDLVTVPEQDLTEVRDALSLIYSEYVESMNSSPYLPERFMRRARERSDVDLATLALVQRPIAV